MENYPLNHVKHIRDFRELLHHAKEVYNGGDIFRLRTPDGGIEGIGYNRLMRDLNALGNALFI